jgi:hypothetical protein
MVEGRLVMRWFGVLVADRLLWLVADPTVVAVGPTP